MMSAKPRLSTGSNSSQRSGLNKSHVSSDDDDELDRSLQELERRHDHLLLGSAERHGKRSAVMLDFTSKLQAENDQLKFALQTQQAEFAQRQMQWEEEKLVMEKRREKSKRALNQELEQASITLDQEVEKCSQRMHELRVGLSAKHEQDVRKLKQEYQDAKTSYEARISALDKSLWEMRTRLTESETKRAGESLEYKMQKEKWESEQVKLQSANAAELEHAKLVWEAELALKEEALQEQHKLAMLQREEELAALQIALQEALEACKEKQVSEACKQEQVSEASTTSQELVIQAAPTTKPVKRPWRFCLLVFVACTMLLLLAWVLANSSVSEGVDFVQQFMRLLWCKLLGWQAAPIS